MHLKSGLVQLKRYLSYLKRKMGIHTVLIVFPSQHRLLEVFKCKNLQVKGAFEHIQGADWHLFET